MHASKETAMAELPHPRRPGSQCQVLTRSNHDAYKMRYGKLARTRSGYREFTGWEDAVYVETTNSLYCVVRVKHLEIICYKGDVRDMPNGR